MFKCKINIQESQFILYITNTHTHTRIVIYVKKKKLGCLNCPRTFRKKRARVQLPETSVQAVQG